jgi:hypothetical protein
MGLYAIVPNNSKLPWMQVSIAPKELINDVKEGRDFAARCYLAQIKDWFANDMRPTVDVIKPLDGSGRSRRASSEQQDLKQRKESF